MCKVTKMSKKGRIYQNLKTGILVASFTRVNVLSYFTCCVEFDVFAVTRLKIYILCIKFSKCKETKVSN